VVEVTGKKPGRHAPIGAALAKLAERAKLSSDKHVPAQGPTWRAELRERNAEAGALELEAQKSVSRNIVADLAHRLRELLMQNDTVDELERLDRSEFVVDVHGRDEVLRKNALAASQLRADIKANDLGKKLVAARVREECWDAMQVPRTEVHALLKPECAAENFALAKQKAAERRELECVKQMRVVELHEQREAAGHGKANKAPGVPGDVSWIVNEGALPATTEPVAAVEASGKKKDAGGAGGDAKAGAPQAGDDELGDLEDDDRDGAALPEIDASNIASLLYPPTALVTQTQQRAQIVLIAELVRQMMLKFNERFDKVMALKLDETDRIEEKNARVREILFELKSSEAFFEPAWAENERPERVLEVPEAEMMSKPYETEQMREARLAAAEEKRKREEEARKDNIGERALNDMMYGQLENKKDNLAVAEDLVAPVWMAEVAEEDYSDEQRKEADAFEATKAALAEEREKQRKALELELKKLRIEVNDIAKAFDEKVAELAERHLVVRNEMGVQELYSSRLALQVMVLDDHHVQSGALEAQIGKLETEKQALRVKVAAFAKSVETARDAMAALSEEDKQLEKDFKKEMQGVSTATIDQEGMRALLSLYRMRVVANANAGGTGSFRGSGTMNRSRAMGTSIGGADALSPGSNMRRASRFGGGTMLDVAGAMGKARRGSNFRGSSGNRMTSAGESPDSGSMKSAMARAIAKVREAEQSDHDPFKEIDDTKKRQAAAAAAPRVQALSMERDCPDGYRPEEAVWARMQELRVVKVQKEAQVKAATAKHAELKKQLDALAAVGDALSTDVTSRKALLRKLTSSMALSGEDVEVLVKLRQGQDEVEQDAVVTDYSGAMLISVAIVEKVNTSIKELGGEQVKILQVSATAAALLRSCFCGAAISLPLLLPPRATTRATTTAAAATAAAAATTYYYLLTYSLTHPPLPRAAGAQLAQVDQLHGVGAHAHGREKAGLRGVLHRPAAAARDEGAAGGDEGRRVEPRAGAGRARRGPHRHHDAGARGQVLEAQARRGEAQRAGWRAARREPAAAGAAQGPRVERGRAREHPPLAGRRRRRRRRRLARRPGRAHEAHRHAPPPHRPRPHADPGVRVPPPGARPPPHAHLPELRPRRQGAAGHAAGRVAVGVGYAVIRSV